MSPTNGTALAAPAAAAPVAAAQLLSDAAPSGLRRLQAADGLFLRAEHLNQIQIYAASLSRLATMAGGAGTVWGYDLSLPDDVVRSRPIPKGQPVGPFDPTQGPVKDPGGGAVDVAGETVLTVLPGLAVSAAGRPLRSQSPITVDLVGLETGVPGRFWVVEVLPAPAAPAGDEPAYTAVCATSCGSGAGIQPWADERVQIRVRAMQIDLDWQSAEAALRRSALASAWFERERRLASPWLTPVESNSVIPPLPTRPWSSSAPAQEPADEAVPLGLLLEIDGRWSVDVWAARRDNGETPPTGAWMGRLSMRPEQVFAAQMRQFEAQLIGLDVAVALPERFVELPPGGFVDLEPGDTERESLEARLDDRFGDLVDINLRVVTPDEAIRQVSLAQHLDRIPLRQGLERRPVVDVWFPGVIPDLEQTRVEFRSWVGFTHGQPSRFNAGDRVRDVVRVAEEKETVGVHVVRSVPTRRDRREAAVTAALEEAPAATLSLSGGAWQLASAQKSALRRKVGKATSAKAGYLVVSSSDPERVPLLTARALALAEALGVPPAARTVHDVPRADGPDAIVVMVNP